MTKFYSPPRISENQRRPSNSLKRQNLSSLFITLSLGVYSYILLEYLSYTSSFEGVSAPGVTATLITCLSASIYRTRARGE
jgi:hypothetical protein